MTGFGQASGDASGARVTVEVRSVNNRYLDLRLRIPSELAAIEGEIRKRVRSRFRRGRVELTLNLERTDGADRAFVLNTALVEAVTAAAGRIRSEYGVEGDLDLRGLLSLPGVLQAAAEGPVISDDERPMVEATVDQALSALERERAREGENLRVDLVARVEQMLGLVDQIRELASGMPALARDRLVERIEAMTHGLDLDPTRVAQEAAIQADRCDVTEEIVRLRGHLEQLAVLLNTPDGEPVGKRLDFLIQEIHRETNTVGSKSVSLDLSRRVLDLKNETEKVREQIQNLE